MWPATERFGLRTAPSGLALVQDLLNTDAPAGRPTPDDLLSNADSASSWAHATLGPDAPSLTASDAEHLRTFRTTLRTTLHPGAEGAAAGAAATAVADGAGRAAVEVGMASDGGIVARPAGDGWRYVVGAVLIAARDAQLTGEWPRLKVCRNDACGTAFYDRSRNSSAVWHDAARCGNAPNLRASRARRRTT
ncbi:CGNR zinc finger domain-containing protein [Cryptosporangium sp. NPDC048952]|uniref:CGNR zinc finger domain-containing protein n=1 Tax=Cryptosporangium sp. NPDC048952 TaxID=3363961 RepID=UPI00371F4F57